MLTIVIPTFRRPHLLPRAIDSVLNQVETDFTLLVVDNGSQDATASIVENYQRRDCRVKYLENKEHIGASQNIQYGLNAVNTPLVSLLSDDDFLAPDFLKDCLKYFTSYPDIAFVGGGGTFINEKGKLRSFLGTPPPDGYYEKREGYFAYVNSMFYPIFGALIFKTSILKKIGIDQRLVTGSDQDIIARIAASYPVYFLCSKDYYFFLEHSTSLSRHNDPELHEKEARILHENLSQLDWSMGDRKWLDNFLKERLTKIFSKAFKHYLSQKEFLLAYGYAKKAWRLSKRVKHFGWMCQAQIFRLFPFALSCYEYLKKLEKAFRNGTT